MWFFFFVKSFADDGRTILCFKGFFKLIKLTNKSPSNLDSLLFGFMNLFSGEDAKGIAIACCVCGVLIKFILGSIFGIAYGITGGAEGLWNETVTWNETTLLTERFIAQCVHCTVFFPSTERGRIYRPTSHLSYYWTYVCPNALGQGEHWEN